MGSLPGGLERGGRSWESLQVGTCREALEEGREGSGGPSVEPGGDSRDGRGREAILESQKGREGQERSGFPPGGPGGVERQSQKVSRCRESLLEGWDGS